jgi:hypothetical protein
MFSNYTGINLIANPKIVQMNLFSISFDTFLLKKLVACKLYFWHQNNGSPAQNTLGNAV